jgi:hypothetical protein
MTSHSAFFAAFAVMFVLVLVWLGLVAWVLRRLKARHVDVFDHLGRPGLILNNAIRNNWLFLRFLGSRAYAKLGDQQLRRACDSMLVFLGLYTILLVALSFLAP